MVVQYVHAVQDHEGQQKFVLKGAVQRELMYVQHHEGQHTFVLKGTVQREIMYVLHHEEQQIFVPKGPAQRELKLTQIFLGIVLTHCFDKKKEDGGGRKGERKGRMGDRVRDGRWEMGGDGGDRRREKGDVKNRQKSLFPFPQLS